MNKWFIHIINMKNKLLYNYFYFKLIFDILHTYSNLVILKKLLEKQSYLNI